jgi:hypothetical protein
MRVWTLVQVAPPSYDAAAPTALCKAFGSPGYGVWLNEMETE